MYNELVEGLSDDDLLKFTQGIRKKFVEGKIVNGMPVDEKEQSFLLTALADMDRTSLGNKRIGANEKQAAADAMVARAIAQVSRQLGETNPYHGDQGTIPDIHSNQLPDANPVDGETDIGISEQNYDELMKKFD